MELGRGRGREGWGLQWPPLPDLHLRVSPHGLTWRSSSPHWQNDWRRLEEARWQTCALSWRKGTNSFFSQGASSHTVARQLRIGLVVWCTQMAWHTVLEADWLTVKVVLLATVYLASLGTALFIKPPSRLPISPKAGSTPNSSRSPRVYTGAPLSPPMPNPCELNQELNQGLAMHSAGA